MSTTITVFSDVYTPFPGFSTTTVSPAKEELGPGWAMDDVYPPLAELRRALLTDEEWAAMSSWEKDVWEMYYRPDWERLACIEQILVDTPAAQREQRHEEILEALRNLEASVSISVDHLDESRAVSVDAASSAVVEEGPEVVLPAPTGFITTVPVTCSTGCSHQQSTAAPVLVLSSPPTPTKYVLDINRIHVAAAPLAMMVKFPAVMAATNSTSMVQMKHLYNDSEFFMPTSSHRIASKVSVHRPIPWPSFLDFHANVDETRPLPWPSFRICAGIELSILNAYVMVRSLELKLLPNGSTSITLLTVFLDSGNCASLTCEYLGVHIIDCIGSSLLAGCSLVVCQKSSVRSSTHYLIASESVARLLCTLDWQLLDSHCRAAVEVCLSCAQEPDHYFCSSVLKELLVLKLMRSSSNYVLCDEWVLSPWDPGQAVISDFANVFYSQANFGMYPKKLMLQSLKVSGSNGHFVIKRYPPNKVVMPCFICEPLPMEKTMIYAAKCCIPSSDNLQEAMKLTAMSVPWQYFSQAELNDSGNSISICRRLDSELESISVVPFLSVSCDTTVHDMLSKMEYMIFIVSACSSCLNDGVIYTPWICVAGPTLITLHKPQTPVQGMSRELLIREPYGRYCCSALFSLDLHRILSLNGSGIPSHVVLLSFCGKPHGIGCLWQGSIHAEVTFWLDYSFIRISKMPQTRQSPHAHCSTGLQIGISVPKCFLCQLFLVMAPLISLLEKQLLPTWPRPNAYCLITNTMFWDAYLSSMIIYKEWRQTHYGIIIHICELPGVNFRGVHLEQVCEPSVVFSQNTVPIQIGWPPRAQVSFLTIEGGMLWLLVDMRIPSSPTSTGNLSDAEQWDNALDCLFNAIKGSQISWNLDDYLNTMCNENLLRCIDRVNPAGPTFPGNKCGVGEVAFVIKGVIETAVLAGKILHKRDIGQ